MTLHTLASINAALNIGQFIMLCGLVWLVFFFRGKDTK